MNKLTEVQNIKDNLIFFSRNIKKLEGLDTEEKIEVLAKQINDSVRRVKFVRYLAGAKIALERMDPSSVTLFDPLRAAVLRMREGNIDEACWLVFLAVHFGKHKKNKWSFVRKIYGKLGDKEYWSWNAIKSDPVAFGCWLSENINQFDNERFSNHRKYESLKQTRAVFTSYINWVQPYGGYRDMIRQLHTQHGQNPYDIFDVLYKDMNKVERFGRLAKFDFLTMLGKLGIAPIEPKSAYLKDNATGPVRGARLLIAGDVNAKIHAQELEKLLKEMDGRLNVGMQVLEDSLCNWQKSPNKYKLFNG